MIATIPIKTNREGRRFGEAYKDIIQLLEMKASLGLIILRLSNRSLWFVSWAFSVQQNYCHLLVSRWSEVPFDLITLSQRQVDSCAFAWRIFQARPSTYVPGGPSFTIDGEGDVCMSLQASQIVWIGRLLVTHIATASCLELGNALIDEHLHKCQEIELDLAVDLWEWIRTITNVAFAMAALQAKKEVHIEMPSMQELHL